MGKTGKRRKADGWRIFLLRAAIIAGVLALLVFALGPAITDKFANSVSGKRAAKPSARALELHKTLVAADLHSDSLLMGRDLLKKSATGHEDVPRMIEGRIAFQIFAAVTQSPNVFTLNHDRNDISTDSIKWLSIIKLWPVNTWNSPMRRALYQASEFKKLVSRSGGRLYFIRSSKELANYLEKRKSGGGITAGMLAIEGAHALEGKIENLQKAYDAGFRVIGLAHFFDNQAGGSAHGIKKGGLTQFGRELIKEMDSMRMIIDLAHASPAAIEDVLAAGKRPVIVSHTGIKGACGGSRNLSDEQAKKIAQSGGLIGIGFWDAAVCGSTPLSIAKSIKYAVELVGADHVALGSDFDGFVQTPFDASGEALLTEALLSEGLSEETIKKVMGQNALEFFLKNLPKE